MEMADAFLRKMYLSNPDFVFHVVTRDSRAVLPNARPGAAGRRPGTPVRRGDGNGEPRAEVGSQPVPLEGIQGAGGAGVAACAHVSANASADGGGGAVDRRARANSRARRLHRCRPRSRISSVYSRYVIPRASARSSRRSAISRGGVFHAFLCARRQQYDRPALARIPGRSSGGPPLWPRPGITRPPRLNGLAAVFPGSRGALAVSDRGLLRGAAKTPSGMAGIKGRVRCLRP